VRQIETKHSKEKAASLSSFGLLLLPQLGKRIVKKSFIIWPGG
jgi:hypothetical protein